MIDVDRTLTAIDQAIADWETWTRAAAATAYARRILGETPPSWLLGSLAAILARPDVRFVIGPGRRPGDVSLERLTLQQYTQIVRGPRDAS